MGTHTIFLFEISSVESLSLPLPVFHDHFLLPPGFFPENEGISAPPPNWSLIGIYEFYESWSTETFRNKKSEKQAAHNTYH
jgi:hypothetical protein